MAEHWPGEAEAIEYTAIIVADRNRLKASNAELLEALTECRDALAVAEECDINLLALESADAAIAKARGHE